MRVSLAEATAWTRDKWELAMTVPMRFSRLVLFRFSATGRKMHA